MLTCPDSRNIVINHPILGRTLESNRLGHMSYELCQWLMWKLDEIKSLQDDPNDNFFQKYFEQSDINDLNTRSKISAIRGYNPSLALANGRLTPKGLELAIIATQLIRDPNNKLDEEEYGNVLKPYTITKADHVFISAVISIRQAALLKAAHNAVRDAERVDRRELDAMFKAMLQGAHEAERDEPDNTQKAEKANTDLQRSANPGSDELTDIYLIREKVNITQQVQAITFQAGPKRVGYVPTAIFGQKARNDLKNLVKYGLVDLRAHIQGNRGRPKHVFRPSPTGIIVIEDLTTNYGLI